MYYFFITLFLTLFATTELARSVEFHSTGFELYSNKQQVQQQRILEQNKAYLERQKKLKKLLQQLKRKK